MLEPSVTPQKNVSIDSLWLVMTMVVLILLATKFWIDVDSEWDAWSYHIPFAGRLWGLLPESAFHFDATIQQRWQGFALLGEWLQGGLWALTGHLEAVNGVSFFSFVLFCTVVSRRFSIPFTLLLPALLTIPLLQFHVSTAYVDLTAALWFSLAVLMLFDAFARPERVTLKMLVGAAFCGVFAANIKTLYAALFCIVLFVSLVCFVMSRRNVLVSTFQNKRDVLLCTLLFLITFSLTLFVPIKNTVLWGNPVHGVQVKLGEQIISEGENFSRDVPVAHEKTPGPIRWVMSVFEVQNPPFTWSFAQTVKLSPEMIAENRHRVSTEADSDALQRSFPWYRFGGFFREYVILNLIVFALLLCRHFREETPRQAKYALGTMLLLTVLAAFSPMSFHLRYCLYWMITLVSLNLLLLFKLPMSARSRLLSHATCWVLFVFVFWVTGMRQIIPAKYTFAVHRQRVQALAHWKAPTQADAFCYTGFPYTALFTAPLQDNAARVPQYVLYDYGPARILSGPLGGKKLPAPCR